MDINSSAVSWADMLKSLDDFTLDFMADERQQPPMQVREERAFASKLDLGCL